MKISKMLVLLAFFACACELAYAQQNGSPQLTDKQTSLLFNEFKAVEAFALIAVTLVGDAEKTGLSESKLTEYAQECFTKYFGEDKLKDVCKDSKKFLELVSSRDKTMGNITIRVWVIGDEPPIIYHIKFDAGNFDNPSIWSDEVLGHGSRQSTPPAIKDILDEMMRLLAVTFFKVQGKTM